MACSNLRNSFSFIGTDMPSVETPTSKQPENKKLDTPKPPSTPKLTLVLKRKRDDEYVVKDFQVPDDVPTSEPVEIKIEKVTVESASRLMEQSAMESIPPPFDKLSSEGVSPYNMLTSGYGVQTTSGNISMDSSVSMATSGLGGALTGGMDTIPGTELFVDGSSVLEGILSSLPGASHLSVDSGLDFDAGLGKHRGRSAALRRSMLIGSILLE